jgi:hypothetical protein
MTQDPFASPANIAALDYKELMGHLLLFEVQAYEPHIHTVHTKPGEQNPAIRAALTIIDGPQSGTHHEDVMVFPKVLVGQLRSRVGKMVLGRLEQGEPKPGQTAPWHLAAATEADKASAQSVLSRLRMTGPGPAPSTGPPQRSEPPF